MTGAAVIAAYHDLWQIEKSFRMAKTDLRARPIFHRQRDSIEAHPTIVFAALAVRDWLKRQIDWSIKKLVQPSAATAASRSARASTFSAPGDRWQETGLVFTTAFGTAMDGPTSGVTFRRALHLVHGIDPEEDTRSGSANGSSAAGAERGPRAGIPG